MSKKLLKINTEQTLKYVNEGVDVLGQILIDFLDEQEAIKASFKAPESPDTEQKSTKLDFPIPSGLQIELEAKL